MPNPPLVLRSPILTTNPTHSPFGKRKLTSPTVGAGQPNPSKITRTEDDRKLTQEQKVDRIFAKLFEWEPLIQKLETIGPVQKVSDRVDKVESEFEHIRKELVSANIIIQGAVEEEKESYKDLEGKVEKILEALNIGAVDYSNVRRLGKPSPGKNRGIQVKLVRQRDKVRILSAKKNLIGAAGFNKIYINPERTTIERTRDKKLRDAVRFLKS